MCLGIPGKVVRWLEREGTFAQAEVEFDGVRRVVHMACVTEAELGDYVVVHAGIAISRIDPIEAKRIFETIAEWGDDEGWRPERSDEAEAPQ
ncbi:hydrogenase 2 accessory protein HypG [Gimesia alba]|uniref:Hydrogenase 2 accessory protein HypG n=1 Tax=Gimesia alba TaxID=2527973 RepID=A0A517RIX1_9PLAN|nr:HypC/HybG/HupF family hydrogenase formation chaperone [Gimesia alba]QDT43826.1 hydrogenase 2 accessory protein HypG [Gimesia alba]